MDKVTQIQGSLIKPSEQVDESKFVKGSDEEDGGQEDENIEEVKNVIEESHKGKKVDEGINHELKLSKDPNFIILRVWNFPHTVYFDYTIAVNGKIIDLKTLISKKGF